MTKQDFISFRAEQRRLNNIHLTHLTKQERKGKTPEELAQLRLKKYKAQHE